MGWPVHDVTGRPQRQRQRPAQDTRSRGDQQDAPRRRIHLRGRDPRVPLLGSATSIG
ncbi:hypothetical protein PJP07_18650 [Mycobacterium kansasii]